MQVRREEPGDLPILVKAQDKKTGKVNTFKAKWAVMTFSIGVIKSDFVTFVPKLPAWKSETVYMYHMTR